MGTVKEKNRHTSLKDKEDFIQEYFNKKERLLKQGKEIEFNCPEPKVGGGIFKSWSELRGKYWRHWAGGRLVNVLRTSLVSVTCCQ